MIHIISIIMTQKLHSKEYQIYWSKLEPNDKVLIISRKAVDNDLKLRQFGPGFISDMESSCSKLRTVETIHSNLYYTPPPYCFPHIGFTLKEVSYNWCDVFCHKLIIRNYRLLL